MAERVNPQPKLCDSNVIQSGIGVNQEMHPAEQLITSKIGLKSTHPHPAFSASKTASDNAPFMVAAS
jgi:hypothetical protein